MHITADKIYPGGFNDEKMTRLFPDGQGETHFEGLSIELESLRGGVFRRSPLQASGLILGAFAGPLAEDRHTAPREQAIVILSGKVDLSVSDGSRRRFGPGHVLILEDTGGKGHTTYSVNNQTREGAWVAPE